MQDLPPLDALRVFETAARLGHFQQAADALALTPSAVSHRIRSLEDFLQVKLFRRAGRGVELTPDGKAYAESVRAALEDIRVATRRLAKEQGPLTMSLAPAIAMRWLLPRLAEFQNAHPDIELRFSSTNQVIDFDREDVDLAIRFGMGEWSGLRAERLLPVDSMPVCSPDLLDADHPLETPDDLRHHRLLHMHSRPDDWRMWLLLAEVDGIDPTAGPRFDNSPEMLEATIAGLGVAMADRQMIRRDVEAGRLIAPFDLHMPSRGAYHLVWPPRTEGDPRFEAFRRWVMDEAAAERAAYDEGAG